MKTIRIFLLSLAALMLIAGPTVAQETATPGITDDPSTSEAPAVSQEPADALPEIDEREPTESKNRWRYKWHRGRWWYWLPSERWMYWQDGRWQDFVPGVARAPSYQGESSYVAPRVQTDLYAAPYMPGIERGSVGDYYGNYRGYYSPSLNYNRFDYYPSYRLRPFADDYRYSPYRYNPYARSYGYGLRDYGRRTYGYGYPYYGYPYGVRGPYYGYGRVGIGIGIGF